MKSKLVAVLAAVGTLAASAPVMAHHSFAAEFNADDPVEMTGTVTKVEWMNPHTYFYLDVQNDKGDYEEWAFELGSPNGLARRGWTRNSLKVGDVITVQGSRARDGSLKGNARTVMTQDGERLFNARGSDGKDKS